MWEEGPGFIRSRTVAQPCHTGQVEEPGSIPGNMRYHDRAAHGDISRHIGGPIYCSLVARYTSVSHSNITVVESKLVNGMADYLFSSSGLKAGKKPTVTETACSCCTRCRASGIR